MAVKLRLTRIGKKKQPQYRIVVADSRSPRDGRFIEILGYYHPLDDPVKIEIEAERATEYLKNGAKVSATVNSLFEKKGIVDPNQPAKTTPRTVEKKKRRAVFELVCQPSRVIVW